MKIQFFTAVAVMAFVLPPLSASAGNLYVGVDVGAALTEDVDAVVPTFGPPVATTFKLDTGLRFNASVGYRLTEWFAIEGQTGVSVNSFDGWAGGSAGLAQVPVLVNAVFRCNRLGAFEPFVGIGGGGAASVIALDNTVLTPGGPLLDGGDADFVFAWQVFGGVDFRLNEHMRFGVVYRLLATGDSEWDVKGLGKISAERVMSHSISGRFSFEF